MKVVQTIVSFTAIITMAVITISLTTKDSNNIAQLPPLLPSKPDVFAREPVSTRRVSRFLEQHRSANQRAADHCKQDNKRCDFISENGRNTTCCNNKCIDTWYDKNNCGACKKKCYFTDECCRGKCVNLAFDKRHCGFCGNRCKMTPGYCIFGICDYA